MSYSVTELTTLEACDAYLSVKNQEKSRLELTIANLGFALENGTMGSELNQEIETLETRIAQLESHIALLPEGKDRRKQERILRDYEDDLSRCLDRQNTSGPEAKLDRELRLSHLQDARNNFQALIDEVMAHRQTLVA